MTNGFTRDGKFHPINPYNKVRKSRDQKVKQQGIIIRKQRNQLKVISNLPSTRLDDYTPKQLEDLMRKRANTTDFGESMGKEGDQHVMDGKHFISTEGEIFGNGKLFHNNYVENSLRDEEGNVHWNGNMQGWILSTGMVRVRADVKNDFLELELPEKLTSSQIKTIREHIEVHNLGRDDISIDDRSKDYSVTKQLGLRFKRTTKGGRVRLERTVLLHPNARKVSDLMGTNKDFGIEGSRFLTLDGKFSIEEGTHEEIVDRFRKLVGMKKDPLECDSGNEFQERTGVIRTQIDLTGKSLGKPTINIEARTEPTVAQMKTLRDIIKNSDVPKDNIILSDSYIDFRRFENGIGYRLKRVSN